MQANLLAMERSSADGHAVNVGTGRATTVLDVARGLASALGRPEIEPRIERRFRQGDVRHCVADIRKARELLGYSPSVRFEEGLARLVAWARHEKAEDRFDQAQAELAARDLVG